MLLKTKKKSLVNYFIIFFSFLAILVYVLSPVIIENKESNWKTEIDNKIDEIESEVNNDIHDKINNLLEREKQLVAELTSHPLDNKREKTIFKLLQQPSFAGYSVQVLDSHNELIIWNNTSAFDKKDILNSRFQNGEAYFRNYELLTFLSLNGQLNTNGIKTYSISLPVTKHYNLENEYFKPLNLEEQLEDEFNTDFTINFKRHASRSKDGRYYSFELFNNFENKIGVVDFIRPARDYEINKLQLRYDFLFSLLVILVLILLIYKYYYLFKKINSALMRVIIFGVVVSLLRATIFLLNVPSMFFENELLNSSYFSSVFAYGIVRSPLEFFLTTFSALVICLYILKAVTEKNSGLLSKRNFHLVLRIVISFLFFMMVLFVLRGYGASIKSVIFDSTLRYFRDPSLLPGAPAFLMHLNVLILGFCSILIGSVMILIIYRLLGREIERNRRIAYTVLFLLMQLAAFLYDYFQKDPQGTDLTRIAFLTIIFFIALLVYTNQLSGLKRLLVLTLAASFMTINLLSYYNSELERESLKITALELIRPNENYLEYAVFQTLSQPFNENIPRNSSATEEDYIQSAFKIWSTSLLQKEAIRSRVRILNKEYEELGSYSFQFPDDVNISERKNYSPGSGIEITRHVLPDKENNIISGRVELSAGRTDIGFIEVSVLYNMNRLVINDVPPFLASSLGAFNKTVDYEKLRIFDFHNKQLVNSVSDFELPLDVSEKILNDNFNGQNDKWLRVNINGEDYIVYVLRTETENTKRIISVLLKERDVTWNLFDFFKVFFIHTIIILGLLIFYYSWYNDQLRNFKLTYRSKLLFYFLLVSIIPSILLAIYFKDLTEQKNNSAIYYKLNKRVENIDSYLNAHLYNNIDEEFKVYKSAAKDLGINFSLFRHNSLLFSSEEKFYQVGLFDKNINPEVYCLFNFNGMKDCMVQQNIENYKYNSYFRQIQIRDADYIIEVNDLFNSILLPLSDIELDVILFGTYSLVAILVAFFSTLLANQISRPIRRLTQATKSVSSGDLSINIEGNWKGEIKDLTEGFNSMVKDLKKNQTQLAEMERESAWKEMAKQVAHEIKNPLTPMKLSVQQLIIAYKDKSPKFNDIFEKVTGTVINQIDILKNIASEFSNFARMPSLKLVELFPRTVIEEVYNLFSEERIEISLEFCSSDIKINSDEDQLRRTLVNLVRNSLQAKANKITIGLSAKDNNCFIRVSDNGKGIPGEVINKVFEKDFTTKQSGMGLGLSMAKRFLGSIKGDISVESTSPQGTTILITIPVVE